jgi:hypothetical protein
MLQEPTSRLKPRWGKLLSATRDFDRDGSYYEANLNASWEIDVFGGLRRGQEAARAEYEASEAGAMATRLAVAAQSADVYVTIRGLQARIAIARQQAETRRELLSTVKLQFEKGIAAELQMRQVEGSLAQVEAQIPVLEAGLDSAMNALDVLLAVQPGTYRAELSAEASIPVAPGLAETGTPAEMIRRRPDLIVAERRLAAASARIGVAISEYYPKFSLGGLVGSATAIASGNLFTGGASQALGVLGLRWRLFDFGRIDAQIAAARGQEAEALAAYRLAVLRATEDVENSFSALVKREAQVGILTRGESSFARARENSFAAYKGWRRQPDRGARCRRQPAAGARREGTGANRGCARRHCLLPGFGGRMGCAACEQQRPLQQPLFDRPQVSKMTATEPSSHRGSHHTNARARRRTSERPRLPRRSLAPAAAYVQHARVGSRLDVSENRSADDANYCGPQCRKRCRRSAAAA